MSIRRVSLLAGVGALAPLPRAALRGLAQVEIRAALGERGSFQLHFLLARGAELPAPFLPESGDLVRVVVSTDEGEEQRVAMDGVVASYALSTGGEQPELVIRGEDLTLLMDLLEGSGRAFPGMPIETQVAAILAAYSARGVTPVIVAPLVAEAPNPSERIVHQQGTDYAYLRLLARRAGYRFTLDPGPEPGAAVAYWGPEPRGDRAQPALLVDFGRRRGIATLELRFDAMAYVAPQAMILDPVSKAVIPIPAPNPAALAPPLGAVVPPAHRLQRLPGTAKLTPTEAVAAMLAAGARSAEATTGSGELRVTRGRRRLRPGDLVDIRGAADPFDGLYAVSRVHDVITARRHRQRFELLRAGLGATNGG